MNTPKKEAITVEEFAYQYSIGKTKIYEEIKFGRLQALKIGNRTIIPVASARDWFSCLPQKASLVGVNNDK